MNTGTLLLTLLAGKRHFGKKRYRATWITFNPETQTEIEKFDSFIRARDLEHATNIFWQYVKENREAIGFDRDVILILLEIAQ